MPLGSKPSQRPGQIPEELMKRACSFLLAILPLLFGSSVQAAEPAAAHGAPGPAAAHGAAAPAHGAAAMPGTRHPLIGPAPGPRRAGPTATAGALVPRPPRPPGRGQ